MHVCADKVDFDIDTATRLPILFFRTVVDTGTALFDGLFAVQLTAYGMSQSAKLTLGKSLLTQQAKETWNLTIPGTATWEVYGI